MRDRPDVDGLHQAERRRDDLKHQLGGHADRGPKPHHRIGHGREHRQRHRPARIGALPLAHRDEHQHAPDPGADDDQHQPDIEPRACGERRIEREEHRGLAQAGSGSTAITTPTIAIQNAAHAQPCRAADGRAPSPRRNSQSP